MMRRALVLGGLLATALASAQYYGPSKDPSFIPGQGRIPTSANTAGVRVDQKLGDQVPLSLQFKDEAGKDIQLKKYFTNKPVLLLLVFFECPGICTTELNNLVDVLNRFKREDDQAGKAFNVVVVSIEPKEGPEMAANKKKAYLELYERQGAEDGFAFLTGTQENIQSLADSIGFYYRRDTTGNIVHPAALTVLTPKGQISKYFLDTEYEQYPLLDALKSAASNEVGEKDAAGAFLACINMDPMTGKVTVNVLNTLTVMCILTVLILGTSIFVMNRRYNKDLVKKMEDEADAWPQ